MGGVDVLGQKALNVEGLLDQVAARVEARIENVGERLLARAEAKVLQQVDVAKVSGYGGIAVGLAAGVLLAALLQKMRPR